MYIDKNGIKHEHIHLYMEEKNGWSAGWYFSDELEQLHGPFSKLEETLEIYNKYVKQLN